MTDDEKSVLIQAAKDAATVARCWRLYALLRAARESLANDPLCPPGALRDEALKDYDCHAEALRVTLENDGDFGSFPTGAK